MLHINDTITGMSQRGFFAKNLRSDSSLTVVHTRVRVVLCQTVFVSDLVVPHLHFCPPLFLTGLPRTSLPLHLCILFLVPDPLALAAAEDANKNSEEDDAGQN